MRSNQRIIKLAEDLEESFRNSSCVEEDIKLRVRDAISYKMVVGGMTNGSF